MKKIIALLSACLFIFSAISCASTKEIPTGLTAAQLFQGGQNAYSNADYATAEAYYNNILTHYGTDTATYVEARYELGHVYIKTKNYRPAFENLYEVLTIYESDSAAVLPASYKKLAAIELAKIPEQKLNQFLAEVNSSQK